VLEGSPEENIAVMRFASRVLKIPPRNNINSQKDVEGLLQKYQNEITELKKQLEFHAKDSFAPSQNFSGVLFAYVKGQVPDIGVIHVSFVLIFRLQITSK
jgi:hypothetical protein